MRGKRPQKHREPAPFTEGFEVHTHLPKQALLAGLNSEGSAAPPKTFTENELWKHGTNFLLGMQEEAGGFTDSDYDFGGTDSLPNVHVAITALAGMAMLEAMKRPDCPEQLKRRLPNAIKPGHLNSQLMTLGSIKSTETKSSGPMRSGYASSPAASNSHRPAPGSQQKI